VWSRTIKVIFAMITIGDGTVGLIAPREHWLLPAGLQGTYKVARFFADNPNYIRLLGLAQIGFGFWPAPRQYREE
jgi:hypothetical protein